MKNLPFATHSLKLSKIVLFCLLLFYSGNVAAQVKIKRQHLYKFRDNNRFEGIKTKKWKPVSGTLDLSSLVFYDQDWLQELADEKNDSVSIYFNSPVSGKVQPSVFNEDIKYFMDPRLDSFAADWNKFTWPQALLNEIDLSVSKLEGIVQARKGGRKIYFPICFQEPGALSDKSVLRVTFVPDKDMTVDIALNARGAKEPVKNWQDVRMISDKPSFLILPPEVMSSEGRDYTLVAAEKTKNGQQSKVLRNHVFNLYIFSTTAMVKK